MPRMMQAHGQAVALEASAGLALACLYSSSHEYEAEIIRARLAANDQKHRAHRACCAFIVATVAIIAVAYLAA
jgi:hypothetical protein